MYIEIDDTVIKLQNNMLLEPSVRNKNGDYHNYHDVTAKMVLHSRHDDHISNIKHNAYEAFIYYVTEGKKDEKESSRLACRQMTIDYNKHKNMGPLFCLALLSNDIKNSIDMVRFIEGFN